MRARVNYHQKLDRIQIAEMIPDQRVTFYIDQPHTTYDCLDDSIIDYRELNFKRDQCCKIYTEMTRSEEHTLPLFFAFAVWSIVFFGLASSVIIFPGYSFFTVVAVMVLLGACAISSIILVYFIIAQREERTASINKYVDQINTGKALYKFEYNHETPHLLFFQTYSDKELPVEWIAK
jgi:hypothetical protein